LAEVTPVPVFGWDHQFGLPQGIIRTLRTVDENARTINYPYARGVVLTVKNKRKVETDVYLTDQDAMFIEYVYFRKNPASWPGWFQRLVIAYGAKEMLWSVKKDDFKSLDLRKDLEDALSAAKGANGAEDMEVGDNQMDLDMGNTDILDSSLLLRTEARAHRLSFQSINRS